MNSCVTLSKLIKLWDTSQANKKPANSLICHSFNLFLSSLNSFFLNYKEKVARTEAYKTDMNEALGLTDQEESDRHENSFPGRCLVIHIL